MLTAAILATAIASCGQAPVQELIPMVQNAQFAAVISSQATPIVSNTPSSVQISFNTSMDKASTERAINLYTGTIDSSKNPASFNALQLTSMCNGTWRVRNTNSTPISFDWDVYNSTEKGNGIVAANSDVQFNSSLGSKTVRLFVNAKQQQVKATNPATCSSNLYSFTWSADSKTITVTPRTALENGKTYSVAVSTNAKNSSGARELTVPFVKVLTVGQQYGIREEGILQNGQSWKSTIFGVEVVAPKNETIRLPTTVSVESVDPITIPIPFPYPISKVTYYRIRSGKELLSSEGIRYKFSIPDGDNLQDYVVAMLSVNAPALHPELRGQTYWSETTEYLDSERVLSTSTSILTKEGFVFAVAKLTTQINLSSQPKVNLQAINNEFQVNCRPAICPTASETGQITQILSQALLRYRNSMGILSSEEANLNKTIFVRESGKDGSACVNPLLNAAYEIRKKLITLCVESNGTLKADYERTLIHELYHAIQFIYLKSLVPITRRE